MSTPIDISGAPGAPLVIASSDAPADVQGAGIEIALRVDTAAFARLAAGQAAHAEAAFPLRVYLLLEQVRGTHDATILQIWLTDASSALADPSAETFLASVGLYGLRRASVSDSGDGMLFCLDITPHAALLKQAIAAGAAHLHVSIRPRSALADGIRIHIGRVSFCVDYPQDPSGQSR